jgi:PTS system mannose-specific IIA component
MSVGILIITHANIGAELVSTAESMLGMSPLPIEILSVTHDSNPDQLITTAHRLAGSVERGAGVLILSDMFGATPNNIARQLLSYANVRIVSGINLPMLVRVLNYPHLTLGQLEEKALSGGRDGIVSSDLTLGP